ncbi:phosphoglycerate dehydrogenase [Martelella alba]|uniref:Hydroxyacid dehydrogenase n=1 Tax=Martelella alba TaxID=2590451 RepID=A0ABY2SGX0_9HYPH|nr:phosphoglycerate dehydrogenase [Martelella alba]TKI03370.1 hydroxyacid dehydrogenase [Martelella alba]
MYVLSLSPSFAKYDDSAIKTLMANRFSYLACRTVAEVLQQPEDVRRQIAAIIAGLEDIDARLMDALPQLRIIAKHGVGIDNIDTRAARQRSILVTNVPNANRHAVADFAFAQILNCARLLPDAIDQTRQGAWPRVFAADVYGKTLGIVGLGNIGKGVARRASGFDMRVLAYDPFQDNAFAETHHVTFVELDRLVEESDFISIHMPLTPQSTHLFDAGRLSKMKKTAYLINAARGGIVNEDDLYQALVNKDIAGAALDAFSEEPVTRHPLFTLKNLLPTAHIAGYTEGAVNAVGNHCVRQIIDLLIENKTPPNVVGL